jgi:zona occludens toxin
MFFIITGKPGASKTLHAIEKVEKMRAEARKERGVERPVFYWNIGDVTLDGWQPLGDPSTFDLGHQGVDPDKTRARRWFECPKDSIIVLDECQKLWPKRKQGSEVPPYVAHLETHRKAGFDILGISQDPTLIDSHVRKLCGLHTHYRRIFGSETYHSFTWQEKCVTDVESTTEQAKALEARGAFPKQYYGTFRSAQVHNVQVRPPWKWIATLAAAILLIPFLVWLSMSILKPDEEPQLTKEELQAALQKERHATVSEVVTHVKALIEANPWDARLHQERIYGVSASKPFYDELIRPVSFPKITGCAKLVIDGEIDCWCNSQQGTKLDMSVRECLKYLERGWFDFTKPDLEEDEGPPVADQPFNLDSSMSSPSPDTNL